MQNMEQWQALIPEPVRPQIMAAIGRLLEIDRHLLEVGANERSITARLMLHLQAEFPKRDVDCEYNRNEFEPKRMEHLGLYPDQEDDEAQTVFPDIIVHQRGDNDHNHLVIEVRKSNSRLDPRNDCTKLQDFIDQLDYEYAVFLVIGVHGNAGLFEMKWRNA